MVVQTLRSVAFPTLDETQIARLARCVVSRMRSLPR
jgi:hypothetical protein